MKWNVERERITEREEKREKRSCMSKLNNSCMLLACNWSVNAFGSAWNPCFRNRLALVSTIASSIFQFALENQPAKKRYAYLLFVFKKSSVISCATELYAAFRKYIYREYHSYLILRIKLSLEIEFFIVRFNYSYEFLLPWNFTFWYKNNGCYESAFLKSIVK